MKFLSLLDIMWGDSATRDFARSRPFLSDLERHSLTGGDEIRRALGTLSRRFDRIARKTLALEQSIQETRQAVDFYTRESLQNNPAAFFPEPSEARVSVSRPQALSRGEVVDLAFASEFTPSYSPFKADFERCQENRTAYARMWRHPKGQSLGRIILLHGWFMGDHRINAAVLIPGYFYRLGLDVVVFELPFHGRRAPSKGNGEPIFPSTHLPRTNEAMAQAISDLRALSKWLQRQDDLPIGVGGVSLGGYIAALWAALDELDFVLPMVPLVNMAPLAKRFWEFVPTQASQASQAEQSQQSMLEVVSDAELEQVLSLHCPLRFSPKTSRQRSMILAGLHDSILGAEQPRQLWLHWGEPAIHWFEGGHLRDLARVGALSEIHNFLCSIDRAHRDLLQIGASSSEPASLSSEAAN